MKITDKERCDAINYVMLSDKSYSYSDTPDGGSCIITYDELIGDEPYSYAIQDCDCSDPFMYQYYYKGRF